MARVGLARLEYLLERVDRALDLAGSDVTVNTLTSDLGVTVTAGGLLVTAGGQTITAGGLVVTAGNVGVTAGNLSVTAGNLEVLAGRTMLLGLGGVIRHQAVPEALANDTAIITAAFIKKGLMTCAVAGSSKSKATGAATAIESSLSLTRVGESFDFHVINTAATDSGYSLTITGGSGVTMVGNNIVSARGDTTAAISVGAATFRLQRTGAGAISIYRIG